MYRLVYPLILGMFLFIGVQSLAAMPAPEMIAIDTGSELATWTVKSDKKSHDTPVIYLHGGPGMYTEQQRIKHGSVLREQGFDTIYYDQVGGGLSKKVPANEYTIARAVADLEALRSKLNHDRVILWGSSFGATLATIYAQQYPDRVAGLIFVSPGTFPGDKPKRNYKVTNRKKVKLDKAFLKTVRAIDKKGASAESEYTQIETGKLFDEVVNGELLKGMVCKGSDITREPTAGGGNLYANRLIQKTMSKMKFKGENLPSAPAIIIRGSCDFIPLKNANVYKSAFNARLVEIPDNGHGLLEKPDLLLSALSDFAKNDLGSVP